MNRAAAKPRLALLLDRLWVAVVLSALYPTIFALSNNWYSIGTEKIIWLVAVSVAAGLAVYLLVEIVVAAIDSILAVVHPAARDVWARFVRPSLFAAACAAILFVLLAGTLEEPLRGRTGVEVAFAAATVGIGVLFAKGLQRYFIMALGLLIMLATGSGLLSFGEYLVSTPATAKRIARKGALELAKFAERPNIYLFIYDAYGSEAAYRKVFGYDNSPHYRALGRRGFKVVHTFSNYWATWPTTLGVFLGSHHYYGMSSGVDDTKFGRKIMAGLAHNPVFETLRSNGYRIQQIHGIDYFVTERGKLDYLFPEEPVFSTLKIYSSPVVTALFGKENVEAGGRSIEKQREVLFSHLPDPPAPAVHPWLTFSHVNLPKHGPTSKNWLALEGFEKDFVQSTVRANEHMLAVMDAIAAKDPGAIVVIIGDHGAWRYRNVWTLDADPNRAFEKAGVEPEIVAYDIFGVMIAVRSADRCDDYVYPGVTPVNVMRVVFACLARDPKLLESRAGDVSLARLRKQLWLAAKEGRALPQWQPYDRQKHDLVSVP